MCSAGMLISKWNLPGTGSCLSHHPRMRAMVVALGLWKCRLKKHKLVFYAHNRGGHASARDSRQRAGCRVYMPGASATRLLMFFIFIPQSPVVVDCLEGNGVVACARVPATPDDPSPRVLAPLSESRLGPRLSASSLGRPTLIFSLMILCLLLSRPLCMPPATLLFLLFWPWGRLLFGDNSIQGRFWAGKLGLFGFKRVLL